jgi:transcription initiation factor TFIID subunit 2
MTKVRNLDGKCPAEARHFILDQLRFNDNSSNEFSDYFYVSSLMNALAESLIPLKRGEPGELSFSFEAEDTEELRAFQQHAVEEIDRYRRMDEWILSYQNIYTTTALSCKQRLMKAKVIPTDPTQFHAYTHDGTLDVIRIKAFEGLVDLGFFAYDAFLKYLLCVTSTDPSPFVRERLFLVFGLGLAAVAFGENKEPEPVPVVDGALIVEQEVDADMERKKAKIKRTTDINAALAAMKAELEDNVALKEAIWGAISSPEIGIVEQSDLLDICYFIYESDYSMTVVLPYPRYWRVENRGGVSTLFSLL